MILKTDKGAGNKLWWKFYGTVEHFSPNLCTCLANHNEYFNLGGFFSKLSLFGKRNQRIVKTILTKKHKGGEGGAKVRIALTKHEIELKSSKHWWLGFSN